MMFVIDSKSSPSDAASIPSEEPVQKVPIVPRECTRFDLETPENVTAMLQHLDEHGYAVIANVVPTQSDIEHAKTLFWEFAEKASPQLKRYDVSTWDNENWLTPKLASAGIIGSPEFSHSEFTWYGRQLPKVRKAFSAVWNHCPEEDLIVSYDAGNAFRPWQINPSWTTKGNWWHTDQNSLIKDKQRKGKVCIQGLITYMDVDADTIGGFCCIPGTHVHHSDMCERTPYAHQNLTDYVKIDPMDPLLTSAPAILPLAKGGDLIIWDSRLIHANTPGLKAPYNDPENPILSPPKKIWTKKIPLGIEEEKKDMLLRLVTYVCMVPRHFATPSALDTKKLAFLQGKAAFHWPQEPIMTVKPYNIEDEEAGKYRDLTNCSIEILRLAGFTEDEILMRQYVK